MKRLTSLFVRFGALGAVSFSILMAQVSVPGDCASPPMGLVGWWRAEGNPLDYAGKNHGTLVGNTRYGTGRVGQAFLFDGSGDGVSVGNPAELQLQDFTIEAWIKRSSLSAASLTPWGGEIFCYTWGGYAFVLLDDGRLLLSKVGYSEVDSSLAITDTNTFHHVAVTKAGSTVVFYLDGMEETVGPYDPGFVFVGPAAIGARGSDLVGSFLGAIDEVSVYNRALLTTEVHAIYSAGGSGKCTTPSPPPCAMPASGLVSWWRAEQDALDFSGANHGTLYNGAAFKAGKVGSAFEFDGLDDHVRIPDQPNLRLTNALTIEGWVKPAAVRHCNFLAKWNAMFGPPLRSYALGMMADGRAYFNVSPNGTDAGAEAAFSTNPVPANAWTYLAGTYDGTALRFYMNGVLQSKVPYTAGIYPGTADLGIACAVGGLAPGDASSPFASLFAGSIDELSVYSRALAGSEIEAIYSAGSTGKCVSPAPPAIAQQPAGQSVLVGGTARFNVGATGTPPPAYQWWFGNTAIAGATDATLVLDNVQLAQAGQYSVLVSNAGGAITSAPALLDVRAVFVRENGQVLPDTNYTRTGSATVELWTGFTSGSVFYTLDGSPPSFVSAFYHGPITLQRSATLRAIAYRADFIESGQSVPIHFTIIPAYPVATHTRGGGSVRLNPPTGPYTSSTAVTVTATPAVGWTFLEWLGDASGTSPVLHLTVNGPKRVEAVFGTMFGKTVAGNGTVLVDPVSPYYPYGTAVRLTAVPQAGNTFRVWGKAVGGTVNPLLFTVTNANSVISALFVPLDAGQHDLSVIPNGNGKVTINPRANTYAALVTLIATPDAGQTFLGWSGDASGTENPLALSMTASKLIIANFTRNPVLSVDSTPEWLPVAGCRLTLASEFGVAYQIQVSANLTEWTPLITLTNVYGRTQFTDEATTQLPHRFYRAVAE